MLLTATQFDEKIAKNELNIAFVGMSNVGKTFWTKRLTCDDRFFRWTVDDKIGDDLGLEDIGDLAEWMGYPYEPRYQTNIHRYLVAEEKHTLNPHFEKGKNAVLDCTGSVIYLSESVHNFLRENFLVISIDVSPDNIQSMTEQYFRKPKPAVWGDSFNIQSGEDPKDALRRCYPEFLRYRMEQYNALADIVIPRGRRMPEDIKSETLLRKIRKFLP